MSLLLYASIALNGIMLLDAVRRRAPWLWFLVLLTPGGGLLYLLSVKLADFNIRPAKAADEGTQPSTTPTEESEDDIASDLAALERAAQESPSFANRVALGWGLVEYGKADAAGEMFSLALRSHRGDKEALLGLGLSAIAGGRAGEAIAPLSEVVDRQFHYRDYQAARLLARALLETGDNDAAIALSEDVARCSTRYSHRLELAQLLAKTGQIEQSRLVATSLLSEWDREPELRRHEYAPTAAQARALLQRLEAER